MQRFVHEPGPSDGQPSTANAISVNVPSTSTCDWPDMRILSTSEQRYTTGLEAFLERENSFYYLGVTEGCRRAGTVALTILDDNFFFSFFFSFLIKTNFEKLNLIFQIVSNSRTRQDVKCLWCCFNLGEE